mgnify:CR=1 FL=1
MKILIATGIYPPDVGGPAQYAKNLAETWRQEGKSVRVKAFRIERKLPTGLRHIFYFLKIIPAVLWCNFILALDTWSVALPAVLAAKIFGKKLVIRTGGDFLWESYVERTGDLVLLKDFYGKPRQNFNFKERLIFRLTGFVLRNADKIIFSTDWQRKIFTEAYALDKGKTTIVENFYGKKESDVPSPGKVFLAATRPLKWKNISRLEEAFALAQKHLGGKGNELQLDLKLAPYEDFIKKMADCYAFILVSLGDISPNMIMDAIRFNRPFIVTRETGIYDRIKDIAIFVDPENTEDIAEKIVWLSRPENYEKQKEKIRNFSFTHTWENIAAEIMDIVKKI